MDLEHFIFQMAYSSLISPPPQSGMLHNKWAMVFS